MAVRRIGFNDNFGRAGGYLDAPLRGGPQRGGLYGTYRPRPVLPPMPGYLDSPLRGRMPVAPTAPAAPPVTTSAPVTSTATESKDSSRVQLDDPEILSDPLLMQVKKLQATRRGDLKAGALARKKELAIQTGSGALAKEFGLDDTVERVANENPLSAFAALREASRLEERDLEEGLNKSNLYFGGYRGTQLGELAKSILAREANEQAKARSAFSAIESDLLGGLSAADDAEMQAEADAYARAVARRAAGVGGSAGVDGGSGGGGAGGSGGGGGGDPASASDGELFETDRASRGSARIADAGADALLAELLRPPKRDPLLEEILRGYRGGRWETI